MKTILLSVALITGVLASSATSQECVNGSCGVRSVPKAVVQVASQPVAKVVAMQPVRKALRFRPLRRLFGR